MIMTREDYYKRIMDMYLFEFMNHYYIHKKAVVLRSYVYDNDNVLVVADGTNIHDVYGLSAEISRLNQDIIILSNDGSNNMIMRVYYGPVPLNSIKHKIISQDIFIYVNDESIIESIGINGLPYKNFYEEYSDKLHVLLSDQLDNIAYGIAESSLISRVKVDFITDKKKMNVMV